MAPPHAIHNASRHPPLMMRSHGLNFSLVGRPARNLNPDRPSRYLNTTAADLIRCKGAGAIDLLASTVLARRRCAADAHIVFISNAQLASGIMRGELPRSVLQQTIASHGVRATLCGPPCNATRLSRHLMQHGEAVACVMIKYADPPVHAFCRSRGAVVILDNVDNYRAFEHKHANGTQYQTTDAVLVQTRWHAEWLARKYALRAIVLPHPHGNLNAWNVMPRVRPRAAGLGLLAVRLDGKARLLLL